jgi:hypothetical protein
MFERWRLGRKLFPSKSRLKGSARQAEVLEQYKIFVASSEALVSRRQGENRFFLTANTLVLGAIGLFLRDSSPTAVRSGSVIGLAACGVVMSYAWFRTIQSYRQLNTGKFEVIHLLEEHLPAALFKAEWYALGEGKDKKRYRPFTRIETSAPFAFALIHIAALTFGVLIATGTLPTEQAQTPSPRNMTIICPVHGTNQPCQTTQ